MKEPASTQPAHTGTHTTRHAGRSDPQLTSWWEGPTKERPNNNQNPKTYREPKKKKKKKDRPRPASSGDQKDCTTESHKPSTIEVHIINSGSQNRSI